MRFWECLTAFWRHKWFVFVSANELGIPWLGLIHDTGNLFSFENNSYGMSFQDEPLNDQDLGYPRLSHFHGNKHHWQYWVMIRDQGEMRAMPMPDKYRREMLADWLGSNQANGYEGDVSGWYLQNRHKMVLHLETRRWIEEQLGLWKK